MEIPPGFVNLRTAYNSPRETFVNIIGIVVDIMPPMMTGKGQHMFTFKLLDPSLRDHAFGNDRLTVRFFKQDVQSLPRVRHHGDVVLLRNIKMVSFSGQPIALSNFQTCVLVFAAPSIPDPGFELAYLANKRIECHGVPLDVQKLTLAEQRYVIYLKKDMGPDVPSSDAPVWNTQEVPTGQAAVVQTDISKKRSTDAPTQPDPKRIKPSTFGIKYRAIRDLEHLKFADICAQVVKSFPTPYGYSELYVTDYTENQELFYRAPPENDMERGRDGDTYDYAATSNREWPGPYGFLVLRIDLKDPHAYYANREVKEGDIVLLKNVRIKFSTINKLEGSMWPDSKTPDKILISKINGTFRDVPEVHELEERKAKYWKARNAKAPPGAPTEPKADREKKAMTKTERKKLKKEAKLSKQVAESNGMKGPIEKGLTKIDINPHIRCSNEDAPTSTVKTILDLDNARHQYDARWCYLCLAFHKCKVPRVRPRGRLRTATIGRVLRA